MGSGMTNSFYDSPKDMTHPPYLRVEKVFEGDLVRILRKRNFHPLVEQEIMKQLCDKFPQLNPKTTLQRTWNYEIRLTIPEESDLRKPQTVTVWEEEWGPKAWVYRVIGSLFILPKLLWKGMRRTEVPVATYRERTIYMERYLFQGNTPFGYAYWTIALAYDPTTDTLWIRELE